MPVMKRKRMFRGAARGRVFQTVDLGAGAGEYMARQAKKFPKRKYAAVDLCFYLDGELNLHGEDLKKKRVSLGGDANHFLNELTKKGIKVRHLNMDFPYPIGQPRNASRTRLFEDVIRSMHRVLLPNGKLFITSESLATINFAKSFASECGYTVRDRELIQPISLDEVAKNKDALTRRFRSFYRSHFHASFAGAKIYRLEITYNLKKAIPSKEARRRLKHSTPPKKAA